MTLVQRQDDARSSRRSTRRCSGRFAPTSSPAGWRRTSACGSRAARALRRRRQPDPRGADAARGRGPGDARAEQGLSRFVGLARATRRSDGERGSKSRASRCAGRSRKAGSNGRPTCLAAFHRLSRLRRRSSRAAATSTRPGSRSTGIFTSALVAACGSPMLMSIREGLFDQAERYVALSIISRFPTRNDVGEHEQIMRAHSRATSRARRSCISRISSARPSGWRSRWATARRVRLQPRTAKT